MAEDTAQDDKTEEPTARRIEKAREDGQVLRSQELTVAVLTSGFIATLIFVAGLLGPTYVDIFTRGFLIERHEVFESNQMVVGMVGQVSDVGMVLIPIFATAIVLAVFGATLLDGFVFSWKAVAPKASKINPISGFARIFGLKALVELFKSLMKFLLVAGIGGLYIYSNFEEILRFSRLDLHVGIEKGLSSVIVGAFFASVSLMIIAAIDVPYQRFEFIKKLKMTKQEIKDEMKEMEGQPEVKQKIKQKQREMAEQKMLQDVPTADVVITNPEHFSVALSYDQSSEDAPRVVAKGKGFIAAKIREIANENKIHIVEAPPLARAIYFTTDVGARIPAALYMAVAQVIAYVYSLKDSGVGPGKPKKLKAKVPKELRFDERGKTPAGNS